MSKSLSRKQNQPVVQHQKITVQSQVSGPIPSPETLKRYEELLPGAAGRIMAMAEDNSRHFQTMDKMRLTAAYTERSRGQWFGLMIGLAGFATAAYGFYTGHAQEAAWLAGTTIVSLVAIFVIGKLKPSKPSPPKPDHDESQQ